MNRIVAVSGHYAGGKTEFAVNLALHRARRGGLGGAACRAPENLEGERMAIAMYLRESWTCA